MEKWGARIKRHRVFAAVLGFVLALSLGAVAAWLVGGGGDAYTKAGEAADLTTEDVSASVTAELFPSDTGDALIRITNPNGGPVTVDEIAQAGNATDMDEPTCDLGTTVSLATQTDVGTVPGGSSATFTLTDAVSTTAAFPSCVQGDRIAIPVSLAGSLG
jgi:hypothetical protein